MPVRPVRAAGKASKNNKAHKSKKTKHRGGAIYSFNLDDKIGGLPANISLNGTQDGDCPASGALDIGFTNYGLTKGGAYKKHKSGKKSRKNKLSRKSKKSRKHKKSKSHKHKK